MNKKEYDEYLKTPEWNEKRKAKLWLVNNTCELCNATNAQLHIHHKTYDSIGNEKARDLIVLCEKCHETFHDKKSNNCPIKTTHEQELIKSFILYPNIAKRCLRLSNLSEYYIIKSYFSPVAELIIEEIFYRINHDLYISMKYITQIFKQTKANIFISAIIYIDINEIIARKHIKSYINEYLYKIDNFSKEKVIN